MSAQHPPVTCKEFKSVLKSLGFEPASAGSTSHEQWKGKHAGKRRLVTVDCPKAPFTRDLLRRMLEQLGMSKAEFYQRLRDL